MASGKKFQRTSIVASMQYSATMNSALFEFYRKYRANLIVLPPYSSELNPIEKYLVCIE